VRAPIDLDWRNPGTTLFIANTRICKERKEMKKCKNGFLPLYATTCHLTSRKKRQNDLVNVGDEKVVVRASISTLV
jgi:hypothetical protein